jgi:hypothetical protein
MLVGVFLFAAIAFLPFFGPLVIDPVGARCRVWYGQMASSLGRGDIMGMLPTVRATMCLIVIMVLGLVVVPAVVRESVSRPMLIGLPYSHYVELARWSLQRGRVGFVELALPVGPHAAIVGFLRLCFPGGLASSTSFPGADQVENLAATSFFVRFQINNSWIRRLAGVPAFITSEGTMLPDSWSILEYSGFSIDAATREEFDALLGPAVRRFAYHAIFKEPGIYKKVQSSGPVLMLLFDLFETTMKISTRIMPELMGVDDSGADSAEAIIREAFDKASATLETHPFLGSGRGSAEFGGADLAFAALTGWLLQPIPQYHAGKCYLPSPKELGPIISKISRSLRASRAGNHVVALYAKHRGDRRITQFSF